MSRLTKLPQQFYLRPTLKIARDLLGRYFVRRLGEETLIGRIVEVEAYLGEKDPASHAYRGRTKRNEVMFRLGGHLYVYFTYGMHFCANVVTEREGLGRAVLLRAIEPIQGVETMSRLRERKGTKIRSRMLTNGPAKLCEALDLKRNENGTDLSGDQIFLTQGEPVHRKDIGVSTRIGINAGKEHRWRFFLRGNRYLSRR